MSGRWRIGQILQLSHHLPAQMAHQTTAKGRQSRHRVTGPSLVQRVQGRKGLSRHSGAKGVLLRHSPIHPASASLLRGQYSVVGHPQERISRPFARLIGRLEQERPRACAEFAIKPHRRLTIGKKPAHDRNDAPGAPGFKKFFTAGVGHDPS